MAGTHKYTTQHLSGKPLRLPPAHQSKPRPNSLTTTDGSVTELPSLSEEKSGVEGPPRPLPRLARRPTALSQSFGWTGPGRIAPSRRARRGERATGRQRSPPVAVWGRTEARLAPGLSCLPASPASLASPGLVLPAWSSRPQEEERGAEDQARPSRAGGGQGPATASTNTATGLAGHFSSRLQKTLKRDLT